MCFEFCLEKHFLVLNVIPPINVLKLLHIFIQVSNQNRSSPWLRAEKKNWVIRFGLNTAYLFQCSLLLYKAGKTMGRIVDALSLIKLKMYSLFQKYRALSATCGNKITSPTVTKKCTEAVRQV